MHMVVVGVNFRTAPVEVREKFAVVPERLAEALQELNQTRGVLECVIVSTCNRTELYSIVDPQHWSPESFHGFMESWFHIPRGTFVPYLYMKEDDEAKRHLFRVASGLDSMVIGETQILGQVRDAFLLAQKERATGTIFNMLFKQAITMAKKAHTETGIGENAVSVPYAAVELGKRIFGSFRNKKVLVIGAGEMSELTLKHLHAGGAARIAVMNRTFERARELAEEFQGQAYPLDQLQSQLSEADVVIASTGAAQAVVTKDMVDRVMRMRPSRPLFMIDISVPRNLDPLIHETPNVYLYDIDDLEGIVEANMEERRKLSVAIEAMIDEELERFDKWYRSLGVGPLIRAMQEKASVIHRDTMESLQHKLPDLTERELSVIHKLTKSMLNQMMQDPIQRVKEMAPERQGDEALFYFAKLFALEEQLAKQQEPKGMRPEDSPKASATEERQPAWHRQGTLTLA